MTESTFYNHYHRKYSILIIFTFKIITNVAFKKYNNGGCFPNLSFSNSTSKRFHGMEEFNGDISFGLFFFFLKSHSLHNGRLNLCICSHLWGLLKLD